MPRLTSCLERISGFSCSSSRDLNPFCFRFDSVSLCDWLPACGSNWLVAGLAATNGSHWLTGQSARGLAERSFLRVSPTSSTTTSDVTPHRYSERHPSLRKNRKFQALRPQFLAIAPTSVAVTTCQALALSPHTTVALISSYIFCQRNSLFPWRRAFSLSLVARDNQENSLPVAPATRRVITCPPL